MGVNVSKSEQKVFTDVLNQFTLDVVTNVINSSTASSSSIQNVNVIIKNSVLKCEGGGISITQNSSTKMATVLKTDTQAKTDIENQISNKIDTFLKSYLDQKNSGIPILQMNVGITIQDIQTKIKNIVSTQVSTTINNSLTVDAQNRQTINFTIDGSVVKVSKLKGGGCIALDQTSQIEAFSEMLSNNILSQSIKNFADNETKIKAETETKQSNKMDLASLLGFGSLGFVGILIFGFIIFSLFKGSGGGGPKINMSSKSAKKFLK